MTAASMGLASVNLTQSALKAALLCEIKAIGPLKVTDFGTDRGLYANSYE